ncbi:MAG: hypothetical protein EXS46_00725 [Candidatus Taylorbacteria bacterium]|nr:hypothetical protein [Candidatus Taylorbacteria bacterium]
MSNLETKIALFKNIARIAGSNFSERFKQLTEQCKLLGLESITSLSGLSPEEAENIMINPDLVEQKVEK